MLHSASPHDHANGVNLLLGSVPEYLLNQPQFRAFADWAGMFVDLLS
jgi:hypothetical protein